jgi:hypothetical protein
MGTCSFSEVISLGGGVDYPPSSGVGLIIGWNNASTMSAQACHGVTFTFLLLINQSWV